MLRILLYDSLKSYKLIMLLSWKASSTLLFWFEIKLQDLFLIWIFGDAKPLKYLSWNHSDLCHPLISTFVFKRETDRFMCCRYSCHWLCCGHILRFYGHGCLSLAIKKFNCYMSCKQLQWMWSTWTLHVIPIPTA